MRVVNFFAGHGTWTAPFRERGHDVWSTDIVDRPGIDHVADILEVYYQTIPAAFRSPDIVLASPDCQAFSVASIGTHWGGGPRGYVPLTAKARNRMQLVEQTRALILTLEPRYFVIENPRGMLRKLDILEFERRTVWYCHYGDERAKPTDLWGGFPPSLEFSPECHNKRAGHGPECCCADHAPAPRGAKTGTQGREKDARSFIPYELALEVCLAAERDLEEVAA